MIRISSGVIRPSWSKSYLMEKRKLIKDKNGTYISKVNFIFESRSPAKILIKLSTKAFSVTCSWALSPGDALLSLELLLVACDMLDIFLFTAFTPVNMKCNRSLMIPGSFVYSIKLTLSKWSYWFDLISRSLYKSLKYCLAHLSINYLSMLSS